MAESWIKDLLIDIILTSQKMFMYQLIGYEIMDNHIHLIIRTVEGGASISQIMQYIKGNFAKSYNRRMMRTGPFWNERFGDSIIEESDNPVAYLLWLIWYLAYNPVRKRKTSDPRNYRYTSLNSYLDESYKGPLEITLHDYFIKLGNTAIERLNKFLLFEEMYRRRLFFYGI